jgi:alcohol dehydrogenase
MIDQYPSLRTNWSYPTAVRFGPGRIAELAEALVAARIARPLFVTDPGLVDLPIVAKAREILSKANVLHAVFSKVDGNPTLKNLEDGIAAYKDGGHDGIIAFGGGSAMDVGKLIAFMSGQSRSVFDFEDREDWWTRANAGGIAPIVAVPTTAGTGSEVGRAAVVDRKSVV